jgi:precorrin-8X/cobalt-precorrin-8 methylmutase
MSLMQKYGLPPDEIYRRSFATIDALLPDYSWSIEERQVITRIVHATGDVQLAGSVYFKPDAIKQALAAIACGATLFTDVSMVAAGINKSLAHFHRCSITNLLDQPALAALAQDQQITRSAAAVVRALPRLGQQIVVIGNAPTALLALLDALDEGRCQLPALIIGMPVGFIATRESKAALWERPYPSITIEGTRGGSPAAAATINALLALAKQKLEA